MNRKKAKKHAQLKEFWRRYKKNKAAVVGLVLLCIIVGMAVFADLIVPYAKCVEQVGADRLQWPSVAHWFGTDEFGRDVFARVVHGARYSLFIGVATSLMALVAGAILGASAGYFGGMVDNVMQRIVEIIYSIPEMLIILLLSATLKPALEQFQNSGDGVFQKLVTLLGPNLISMFIAFGLLYWVTMSRIIRGQILQLKQQEYVTAARALGAKGGRIISKHLLPNCIGQIVTTTFLQIPSAIFLESFLSFLGVGVSAPLTSLGSMCSEALSGLKTYPYRLFIPAVILSVMILSLNLFGDGLRDALDPKLKK